jgi:hypothetical protein
MIWRTLILITSSEIIDPPTPTSVKAKKHCIKKERIGPLDDPVQIVYVYVIYQIYSVLYYSSRIISTSSKQSGANVRHLGRRLSFGTIDFE